MNFDAIVERWHQLRDQMAQIAALENPTAEDERRMHGLAKEFDRADAERLRIERGRLVTAYNNGGASIAGTGYINQGNDSFDRDAFSDPTAVRRSSGQVSRK